MIRRETLKVKDAKVLAIIAAELRSQYSLSVVPSDPIGSKGWHKVKVNLNLFWRRRSPTERCSRENARRVLHTLTVIGAANFRASC